MNKEIISALINAKSTIISATIGATISGVFLIISTIITPSTNDLKNDYKELQINQVELESKINILQEEYSRLKEQSESERQTINNLKEQNEILEEEINRLKEEIKLLNVQKISIFDLEATNSNEEYWFNHSDGYSSECFADKDGHEYLTAHISFHHGTDKKDILNPTYLLNNKYSLCEGQIVWSAVNENSKETAWIEFYSGDTLLYTTKKITSDSAPEDFSFSVKGVKELKIVKNGTESSYGRLIIIYPYLNLIE